MIIDPSHTQKSHLASIKLMHLSVSITLNLKKILIITYRVHGFFFFKLFSQTKIFSFFAVFGEKTEEVVAFHSVR